MRLPQKPSFTMWNHNEHYHPFLLDQIPSGAKKALDVGCGTGRFARSVALRVQEVLAIDRDSHMVTHARAASSNGSVQYVEADVMDTNLPEAAFDFVSCLATLHHLPLRAGLQRLASLVAPGGVLAILGLYKLATPYDFVYAGSTGLIDLVVGVFRHWGQPDIHGSRVPLVDPQDSLPEIRAAIDVILPGSTMRRHMYDRYSIVYRRAPAQ